MKCLSAYQQTFGEKDSGVVQQISDQFLSTVLDLQTPSTQGILLANIVILVLFFVIRFGLKRKTSLFRYWIILNVILISYYIGIYYMFLYSMPTPEALYLAGFERYSASIVILVLGIVMLVSAREIDYSFYEQNVVTRNYRSFKNLQTKKWYQLATLILLFFSVLLLLSENNGLLYNQAQFSSSVPAQFMSVAEEEMSLNQNRYLVVSTDKEAVDSYLVGYVGKYYLYSPNVDGREDFLMDDRSFLDLLNNYDKVVVLEDHFTFNAMAEKLFGKVYEPGIYDISEMIK